MPSRRGSKSLFRKDILACYLAALTEEVLWPKPSLT